MHEYQFPLMFNFGKLVDEVGLLEKAINDGLSTFGVHERVTIFTEIGSVKVTSERELTKTEMQTVIDRFKECAKKHMPECSMYLSMPRCQPSNSSSQSTATE